MRNRILALMFLFLVCSSEPCWAFLDSIIGGVKAVQDEAHNAVMANQLVQLVIEAKKNYDASMKIYQQVKQLNEGRGLVRSIASDLGLQAKSMGQNEKYSLQSELTYRNDSSVDRALDNAALEAGRTIARNGTQIVDQYGNAINQQSADYYKTLQNEAAKLAKRSARDEAGRQEGIKVATLAPDMTSKATGLALQTYSDSVEALNQIIAIELTRDARDKGTLIQQEKEAAQALKFLTDRQGIAKALDEAFYAVRLSRAPGLLSATRAIVSRLAATMLGLMLAAGFLYEYSQRKGFIPEFLGLPFALVIFGLLFYDKVFVTFAVLLDSLEQTVSPVGNIIQGVSASLSSPDIGPHLPLQIHLICCILKEVRCVTRSNSMRRRKGKSRPLSTSGLK